MQVITALSALLSSLALALADVDATTQAVLTNSTASTRALVAQASTICYARFKDMDLLVNDSPTLQHQVTSNLDDCVPVCARDKGCSAFVHASGSCWYKSGPQVGSDKQGSTSVVFTPFVGSCPQIFVLKQDEDLFGADKEGMAAPAPDANSCLKRCEGNADWCNGFTWKPATGAEPAMCYLKTGWGDLRPGAKGLVSGKKFDTLPFQLP